VDVARLSATDQNYISVEDAVTTTQHEPYPFVTKVIDMFGDWLKQRRELNELMEYEAEFGELAYMITALGIDEAALRRAGPCPCRKSDPVAG
jgi:hypothetical protein